MPPYGQTTLKRVVVYKAEFGNRKKMLPAGTVPMIVASARSTCCVLVDFSEQDVPDGESLLPIANVDPDDSVW